MTDKPRDFEAEARELGDEIVNGVGDWGHRTAKGMESEAKLIRLLRCEAALREMMNQCDDMPTPPITSGCSCRKCGMSAAITAARAALKD